MTSDCSSTAGLSWMLDMRHDLWMWHLSSCLPATSRVPVCCPHSLPIWINCMLRAKTPSHLVTDNHNTCPRWSTIHCYSSAKPRYFLMLFCHYNKTCSMPAQLINKINGIWQTLINMLTAVRPCTLTEKYFVVVAVVTVDCVLSFKRQPWCLIWKRLYMQVNPPLLEKLHPSYWFLFKKAMGSQYHLSSPSVSIY